MADRSRGRSAGDRNIRRERIGMSTRSSISARRTHRRQVGVRLYLALAFAAVALIAAGVSYLLSAASSNDVATQSAEEIAVGRAVRLADRVGAKASSQSAAVLASFDDPSFSAWVYDRKGKLITPRVAAGVDVGSVPG